ncbi:Class I SAM-dependent methyltransferase [Tenacibaculum sp. 190130A14a]|uniref:Class I SAM-dependent methyltransferase n=1 Tax=Tenacibaculum polynesiense TaxID=3137857 RepID=A0ABM9PG19_9FLAO
MTTKENDCTIPETINYKDHWNTAYTKNTTEKLGWYEESSKETIDLIKETNLDKNARILSVGVGSSLLIDELLHDGYSQLIANDLSEKALNDIKERLKDQANQVTFIPDNLVEPKVLGDIEKVDIWNDRAVLHFFLTEEEKTAYFNLLKKIVKVNGYVIIAVFALDGAEKCCGLNLQRYNTEMLQERLGHDFSLEKSFNHTFVNPYGGERPYVYTLFKRRS